MADTPRHPAMFKGPATAALVTTRCLVLPGVQIRSARRRPRSTRRSHTTAPTGRCGMPEPSASAGTSTNCPSNTSRVCRRTGGNRDPSSATRRRCPGRAGLDAGGRVRRVRVPAAPSDAAEELRAATGDFQHRICQPVRGGAPPVAAAHRHRNYSCPGESTTSFLLPCIWKTSGHTLHNDYPGSQLGAALAFLAAHRGKVSPITLSLNGNGINEFLQTCPPGDLACIAAGAPAAIASYQAWLTSILRHMRACARDAQIVVVGAYDPTSTPSPSANRCSPSSTRRSRRPPPPCGPGSPTPSPSSTPKATLPQRPQRSARSPCCATKRTVTPPMPATGRSPTSCGPHQATRASSDSPRRAQNRPATPPL